MKIQKYVNVTKGVVVVKLTPEGQDDPSVAFLKGMKRRNIKQKDRGFFWDVLEPRYVDGLYFDDDVVFVGKARCVAPDVFDEEFGYRLALARAYNKYYKTVYKIILDYTLKKREEATILTDIVGEWWSEKRLPYYKTLKSVEKEAL